MAEATVRPGPAEIERDAPSFLDRSQQSPFANSGKRRNRVTMSRELLVKTLPRCFLGLFPAYQVTCILVMLFARASSFATVDA
jgi:hypothetical protein